MSSGGAEVAVATLALASLLRDAVAPVPRAAIVLGPPRAVATDAPPSVGLHLVRVDVATSLAAERPAARPTDVVRVPSLTLELDYLVYVGGDPHACEPEILLALVIGAFAATPIVDAAAGVLAFQAMHPEFDVPATTGPIRVGRLPLPAMDRAALWSMLATPYQLSVEYRAQLVAG